MFPSQRSGLDFSILTLLGAAVLLACLILTAFRRHTFFGVAQGVLTASAALLVFFRVAVAESIVNYALAWVILLAGLIAFRVASVHDEL